MDTTFDPCHAVREDGVIVGLLVPHTNNYWHFVQIDDYVSKAAVLWQGAQKLDELNAAGAA